MKTRKYYAILFPCGIHCTYAETGKPVATAYQFDTKAERDEACNVYTAPSHNLSATLNRATSNDPIIREALRQPCGVFDFEESCEALRQRTTYAP